MEGPFLSTTERPGPPAKRHLEDSPSAVAAAAASTNGSSKRRSWPLPPPLAVPAGHSAFRLLCRIPIVGGVIGRSGSIVSAIRQETGTKIRVEESVPSCDERVIIVVGPDNPKKLVRLSPGEEREVSSAQEALLRVLHRAMEVEVEVEGPATGGKAMSCRMLAPTNQVGFLMGKGGQNIERMRKESGAKIRVLPAKQLPACANPEDELIQITGDALSVKKALIAVSCCLKDSPLSDKQHIMSGHMAVSQRTLPDTHREFFSHKESVLSANPGGASEYPSTGRLPPTAADRTTKLDQNSAQQEVSFKLLCSSDKVGGVIGKGGTIVKALQNETGASISVAASVSESEERIITVSASESSESQFSQAQNAVIRVFRRSVEVGIERGVEPGVDKDAPVTARLLVPKNQVGCLMGKGGAVIQEMRNLSGSYIRIFGVGQLPKCASEDEEVVQITGELRNVQEALLLVTTKLRDNLFPAKVLNGSGMGTYSSSYPERVSYGRVGLTPPRLFPSAPLSYGLDRQSTLAHSMDHLGLSNSIERPLSPRSRAYQAFGGGNSRAIQDTGSGLNTIRGGVELGSGSKSAFVTNTTVDILVPRNVFGLVYGENGNNLSRIRQISGASVIVRDPPPGKSDGSVIISGTPDQTQAAQSLLQAFIQSGQPPLGYYR